MVPGGFATIAQPELRVIGAELVLPGSGGSNEVGSVPLEGLSCADLARAAGLDAGAPAGLYHDGSGVSPAEVLHLDPLMAGRLGSAFSIGDTALRRLAPDATPVLWPEHFDVATTLDEVNYGVSPGDGYCDEPYAYVGPFQPRAGAFWNAPFGALRTLAELSDVDGVFAFFTEGQRLARA